MPADTALFIVRNFLIDLLSPVSGLLDSYLLVRLLEASYLCYLQSFKTRSSHPLSLSDPTSRILSRHSALFLSTPTSPCSISNAFYWTHTTRTGNQRRGNLESSVSNQVVLKGREMSVLSGRREDQLLLLWLMSLLRQRMINPYREEKKVFVQMLQLVV